MSRRRTSRQLEQLPAPIPPWFCPSNKHGYATREDAQAWLRYLQATREPGERTEVREYRCAHSRDQNDHYHLTSDAHRTVAS